jgi:hypothetical protein
MDNHDPFNPSFLPIGSVLRNGQPFRQDSRSPGGRLPTDGDQVRHCPCCGEQQHAVPIRHYDGRTVFYIWNICQAQQRAWDVSEQHIAKSRSDLEKRQAEAERVLGDPGLTQIARFSLTRFDPDRLRVQLGDENPYSIVTEWLHTIRQRAQGDYGADPAVALHLYYPGKGTGKTHLAGGAALLARSWGKVVAFIEEVSYLERAWAADFADKERLSMVPGETAWLTVIDDLGQNPPGKDPRGLQKAWYNVINRRWLKCGWTIITTNKTLEELMNQGTLSEAAYSRLYQMTRGEVVLVDAEDQRLRGAS